MQNDKNSFVFDTIHLLRILVKFISLDFIFNLAYLNFY